MRMLKLGIAGVVLVLVAALAPSAHGAPAAPVTQSLRFTTSDGIELEVKVGGLGPLVNGHLPPRPTIIEFTPYNQACCPPSAGDAYNYAMVHIRGTGQSEGVFDALGDLTQRDVAEVTGWACQQPWTDGRLGLYGFSASAITIYNSLHHELPCVEAAVLGSGTFELYRDLLYPGGVPNLVPGIGVLVGIGGPALAEEIGELAGGNPDLASLLATFGGMADVGLDYLGHPTLDSWWQERGFRGDVNDLPILMVAGFYDVESRGAFQAFQELRGDGAHLRVVGAHDGVPVGSGGSDDDRRRWFDRHLLGLDNGVDDEPVVEMWMSNGDREDMLAGDFVTAAAADWPAPGTTWTSWYLDPARSGSATSLNDGTLALTAPGAESFQPYVSLPSLPFASDPHTISLLGFFNDSPTLTDMTTVEPLGLSYTTDPLPEDVVAAGPASLEVALSSLLPETDIYAIVSDVWPDGTAHPVATGRLRSSFPHIDESRSLKDVEGNVVQPYGRYDAKDPAAVGESRRYHVELWPIGNRFQAGHRIRLHIVGASAFSLGAVPSLNTVKLGGATPSRLLLPVLPASALTAPAAVSAAPGGDRHGEKSAPNPPPDVDPSASQPAPDVSRQSDGGRLPATGGGGPVGLGLGLLAVALGLRRVGRGQRLSG